MLCDSFVLSFNTGFELWKSKFEVEFLDRLQDLELQVRMVCGENIEFKKVISRLYNFATASHSEVKAQNICVAEQIEHLEETLGLTYPCKAQKLKVTGSELKDINRKMEKLQKFKATTGNFVDLSTEKNMAADSVGTAMDVGPH